MLKRLFSLPNRFRQKPVLSRSLSSPVLPNNRTNFNYKSFIGKAIKIYYSPKYTFTKNVKNSDIYDAFKNLNNPKLIKNFYETINQNKIYNINRELFSNKSNKELTNNKISILKQKKILSNTNKTLSQLEANRLKSKKIFEIGKALKNSGISPDEINSNKIKSILNTKGISSYTNNEIKNALSNLRKIRNERGIFKIM